MRARVGTGATKTLIGASVTLMAAVPAWAEPGGLFKDLFTGGGNGAPAIVAPKAVDPDEAYCPPVSVSDNAAVQAFAGGQDSAHLRHQLVLGQLGRECALRADGSVAVKVGVQVRAMLGPAGSAGTFQAPLVISLKYNDKTLDERSRKLSVTVPSGAVQGSTSVVEADMTVPASMAVGYDIEVLLGSRAAPAKPTEKVAARKRKPAPTQEATAAPAEIATVPTEALGAAENSAAGGAWSAGFGGAAQ